MKDPPLIGPKVHEIQEDFDKLFEGNLKLRDLIKHDKELNEITLKEFFPGDEDLDTSLGRMEAYYFTQLELVPWEQ